MVIFEQAPVVHQLNSSVLYYTPSLGSVIHNYHLVILLYVHNRNSLIDRVVIIRNTLICCKIPIKSKVLDS